MSKLRELSEKILPLIAQSGQLGSEVEFVKCICDSSVGEAQFASSVCFVVAVFKSDEEFQQPLVVKYNFGNEAVRKWLKIDEQFQNEVLVYEKVLPHLNKYDKVKGTFPKYFYGSASPTEDPEEYIIVLEDLRSSGYKLSQEILNLDFEHCALAFRKLGSFHALSFAAKEMNRKAFFDVVELLIETKMVRDNAEEWKYLFGGSVDRAAEPILKKGEKVDEIERFRSKLKDPYSYIMDIVTVQEPMGVICHGDFCRNNVLYKYDNEAPVDIKFFDLATARYGSPMLDFCFFLLLNTTEESRKQHREEYLKIYHDSLSSAVPGVDVPSLDDFREEFRRKAVNGFLSCAFFKPAMMDPVPFNPVEEVRKSIEQRFARIVMNGGEKATEVISNMLRELIDLNCVL